jgi:mycofactocin precursor
MRTDELSTAQAPGTGAGTSSETGTGVEEPEELLIEEISIDGMCGVY